MTRFWPFSALGVWLLALLPWALLPAAPAAAASLLLLAAGAWAHAQTWRRLIVLLGVPLALLLNGAPVPAWAWALGALLLLALYPWWLWRDAPLFHTPADAFDALPPLLPLADGTRLLDAGCGSGAALRAWARAYPQLKLNGVEASWPLRLWARWRCPQARIRGGDFWAEDWSAYELVYLFQRPETMASALDKARRELRAGGHLVSLDFPLPGVAPLHELPAGRHRVLVYAAEALN